MVISTRMMFTITNYSHVFNIKLTVPASLNMQRSKYSNCGIRATLLAVENTKTKGKPRG